MKKISCVTKISTSTVHNILERYSLNLGQRLGRPEKFKSRDKAVIIRNIKEQPSTSAPEITKSFGAISGKNVRDETLLALNVRLLNRDVVSFRAYETVSANLPRCMPSMYSVENSYSYGFLVTF